MTDGVTGSLNKYVPFVFIKTIPHKWGTRVRGREGTATACNGGRREATQAGTGGLPDSGAKRRPYRLPETQREKSVSGIQFIRLRCQHLKPEDNEDLQNLRKSSLV